MTKTITEGVTAARTGKAATTMTERTTRTKPNATTATSGKAGTFTKRIGFTTYRVGIHFSGTSRETAQDKITRLVRMEAQSGKVASQ